MRSAAPAWYRVLWRCALPFALARLWWRGVRERGYRRRIGERLGRYTPLPDSKPVIWIHAVSVGETRAAQPLVESLERVYPGHRIVMTTMTAAGRETSESLYGDRLTRVWLPYDTVTFVDRFLDWCRPAFGVLMETELWPNAVLRARSRGVPLILANARMSEKSAQGYARFASLTREVLGALSGVAAQSQSDADRLSSLGAREIAITGNVKFDVAIPPSAIEAGRALRSLFGTDRPLWVAGSTRDGEEALLLDALVEAPTTTNALAVIVPRHPQRFDEVAALIAKRGLRAMRRSEGRPVPADVAVVVGDSMGEMLAYYAAADVALIGGTLKPLGGQNLIEPLAVGTPVVIGPSSYNFSEVASLAVSTGAAVQCADAGAAIASIMTLLGDNDARRSMRAAADRLLAAHRGATARTMNYIAKRLTASTATTARD